MGILTVVNVILFFQALFIGVFEMYGVAWNDVCSTIVSDDMQT